MKHRQGDVYIAQYWADRAKADARRAIFFAVVAGALAVTAIVLVFI